MQWLSVKERHVYGTLQGVSELSRVIDVSAPKLILGGDLIERMHRRSSHLAQHRIV
jgi:hypothetical protein